MKTFSITDVGMVRQVNQDYVYTADKPLGTLENLFVVADGMGGHQAGTTPQVYGRSFEEGIKAKRRGRCRKSSCAGNQEGEQRDYKKGLVGYSS